MTIKYSSDNIFEDLGFEKAESAELKFKSDLYVILKQTLEKKKITGRQLEKLWDVPQPRVSEVVTGKVNKISVGRMLTFLAMLGVNVYPAVDNAKR